MAPVRVEVSLRVETGVIRFYDPRKQFGYIIPDRNVTADGLDVFAHRNQFVAWDGDYGDQPFPVSDPQAKELQERLPEGVNVVFSMDDDGRARLWGFQKEYDAAVFRLTKRRLYRAIVAKPEGDEVVWEGKNIIKLQIAFPEEFHRLSQDGAFRLEWLLADGGWARVQSKDDPRLALIRKTGGNPWIVQQGANRGEGEGCRPIR